MWAWGAQSFPPASSPTPSLISEYVVEEVKEGDFVSTGIHTFLYDCNFLARSLRLRAEAGEIVPLGINRQKSTRRQERTQKNKVLGDKELIYGGTETLLKPCARTVIRDFHAKISFPLVGYQTRLQLT